MSINPLIANNFIDSCAFDPKYDPEDKASCEIFRISRDGKLLLQIAHSTQKEIEHPNTPAWVKDEATRLIYAIGVQLTENEVRKLRAIGEILAGNGKAENILEDARHIFEAQKYGPYFVTTDSRILNRAKRLQESCNVAILRPTEFLILVKRHLSNNQKIKEIGSPAGNNENGNLKPQEKTETNQVLYKGYVIEGKPNHLVVSDGWSINIYIRRDTGNQTKVRHFSSGSTFKTRNDAIQHCIEFGRRIIDGKYPDCTVDDL